MSMNAYRRRMAYPIVMVCVAGLIYLWSRGNIAQLAPAKPEEYVAYAREVMIEVRGGRPIPKAVDPAIQAAFAMIAPESVRDASGGALTFALRGATATDGTFPWVQSVEMRVPNGEGVALSISIREGQWSVTGVSRVRRIEPAAEVAPTVPTTAATESTAP